MSGLARKRVTADVPGLGEVNYRPSFALSGVNVRGGYGSELGPVPWPPAEPSCCEASGAPPSPGASERLFGRHSTVSSELARTEGIRLSN